jgi:hypothetical protein
MRRPRRPNGRNRPIGGRADWGPGRICSFPANVAAIGAPAGPQLGVDSGVLFARGDAAAGPPLARGDAAAERIAGVIAGVIAAWLAAR